MRHLCFVLLGTLCTAQAWALGVPNVNQTPGELIAGPIDEQMGRLAVVAYHEGILFTFPEIPGSACWTTDNDIRAWDVSNPANPVEIANLGTTGHGFNAHGYLQQGNSIRSNHAFAVNGSGNVSAGNVPMAPWSWSRAGLSQPWGAQVYWSYGDTNQQAYLYNRGDMGAEWDHLTESGGVIGHPIILGNLLIYASDQSRTGIATYDISDPSDPQLLDVLRTGGIGGYWPDPVGIDGNLYVIFSQTNGRVQLVDVTDPTSLRLAFDRTFEGRGGDYAQIQDEFAFLGEHKIDLRTFESVVRFDASSGNTVGGGCQGTNQRDIDLGQWAAPVGNLLFAGGNWPTTGLSIWAHQAAPDTRGPRVGYHIPRAGQTNFPVTHSIHLLIHESLISSTINSSTVILRATSGANAGQQIAAGYWFSGNDILSIVPENNLANNTSYEVEIVENGIEDAVGNGIEGYRFSFSTGGGIQGGNRPPNITSFSATTNPIAPGGSTQLSASANDSDNDTLEYRFDFGDGSAQTAWSSSRNASHSYATEGHYLAKVQVRDSAQSFATATTTVTVVQSSSGPEPSRSRQLARVSGGVIWAVHPDNDTLSRLTPSGVQQEIRTCRDPRAVTIDNRDQIWVSCRDDDAVLVLDDQGALIDYKQLAYGSAPFGVAASPSGAQIFVTLYGSGELLRFAAASRQETARLALGPTPRAIAVSGDGSQVLVTRFISPEDGGKVWQIANTGALGLIDTLHIARQWGRDATDNGRGVPNYLASVSISPRDGTAWVTAKKDNTARGLYQSGEDTDQDNTVRAMVAQLDLVTGEELARRDLDNSESPSDIEFSALGDYAFVSLQGNNAVFVLDMLAIDRGIGGEAVVLARPGTEAAPQSVLRDGNRLWVKNFLDRSVSIFDLQNFLASGSVSLQRTDRASVRSEALPADILRGKRIFYHASDPRMSGEGYMSCATCHVDGSHDGRTWDFTGRGEGVRNTTDLRGRAGMAHGLVHWSANFDEIQDFEHDIRGSFGGTGFLSDQDFAITSPSLGSPKAGRSADLDAMAAYVSSLGTDSFPRSPYRNASGGLTSSAMAGKTLFNALDCNACHSGSRLTISGASPNLRDVGTLRTSSGERLGGTLRGIDVPTLHGLFDTAPYFHNGSAAGIRDVFFESGGLNLQAESAGFVGNVDTREADHWSVENAESFREGEFAILEPSEALDFSFSASQGGSASLIVRYAATYQDAAIEVTVNGQSNSTTLPRTLSHWQFQVWEHSVAIPISVRSGNNNLRIAMTGGNNLAVDEIFLTDLPEHSTAAAAHQGALTLSEGELGNLESYLLSLDGRPETGVQVLISNPAAGQAVGSPIEAAGSIQPSRSGVIEVAIDNGGFSRASGNASSWSWNGAASAGPHVLTVRFSDSETGAVYQTQRAFEVDESLNGELIFANEFE